MVGIWISVDRNNEFKIRCEAPLLKLEGMGECTTRNNGCRHNEGVASVIINLRKQRSRTLCCPFASNFVSQNCTTSSIDDLWDLRSPLPTVRAPHRGYFRQVRQRPSSKKGGLKLEITVSSCIYFLLVKEFIYCSYYFQQSCRIGQIIFPANAGSEQSEIPPISSATPVPEMSSSNMEGQDEE